MAAPTSVRTIRITVPAVLRVGVVVLMLMIAHLRLRGTRSGGMRTLPGSAVRPTRYAFVTPPEWETDAAEARGGDRDGDAEANGRGEAEHHEGADGGEGATDDRASSGRGSEGYGAAGRLAPGHVAANRVVGW